MDREALLERYRQLTTQALPARAASERWVVRFDHCFQRIVLDNALGAAWRDVLDPRQPAYRQLSEAQLRSAVRLAEQIEQQGDALLRELNRRSLRWRGKPA